MSKTLLPLLGLLTLAACSEPPMGPDRPVIPPVPVTQQPPQHPGPTPTCKETPSASGQASTQAVECKPLL